MELPQRTGSRAEDSGLAWRTASVDGIRSRYLVGGTGPSVVLLHGFGLANRTYRAALEELVRRGVRVYAPTMPGFGGTAELPSSKFTMRGYAAWVAAFIRSVGITEPVTLIGHSFGGGVAIMTAHDSPISVGRLVLVNSVGGSAWVNGRGALVAMRKRPLWDWGLHLQADVLPLPELTRVLPVILRDGVPAALTHPRTFWRAATLVRTQDLTAELAELGRRGLSVTIIWSNEDNVIPAAATHTLRTAHEEIRTITVDGRHCWLLADPTRFGEVISEVLAFAPATDAAS
ncbi:alpha/beta fold hydrolase [Nocardia sp. NBC_01503]|uniref:alpha/beta fold hydrolase n=1 Tax=Nocardia sp. NBC_01503 TaxID=2975997 RepID=UPI002E7C408A|nr:alpha/beta fold hydrolase [Nocardia sp. NBC_01503]WTL30048.1 alpha/beta fold hydrolase [Nocardia sp. NBC_01503]